MKTILLPLYNGMRARSILRTDTYRELIKDPDIRLVIGIPSVKLNYYKKEFGAPNVIFESLDITEEPLSGQRLATYAFNLLNTTSVRSKQEVFYFRYGNYPKFLLKRLLNRTLGPFAFMRSFIRFLDGFVPLNQEVADFINKYKPDLVIVPDIVFPPDRIFVRAAKRFGYCVVGMVRSWDNLTSKGIIQTLPDKLVVHTANMKKEAVKYADMPAEKIVVTGPPQFDDYYKPLSWSKEELFKKLNIPRGRRLALCSPFLDKYTESAVKIVNSLTEAIDAGTLPKDLHILLRYRTSTPEIKKEVLKQSDHLSMSPNFELFFPVVVDGVPGQDWEFTYADIELLKHILAYSDVVINVDSTLSVDAATFDKPVIDVRFDAVKNCPPKHSIELLTPHFYHYRQVEASGGVRLVKNMEELFKAINAYLENPKLDAVGRGRLRREQLEFFDGNSGKRVADFIKQTLYSVGAK